MCGVRLRDRTPRARAPPPGSGECDAHRVGAAQARAGRPHAVGAACQQFIAGTASAAARDCGSSLIGQAQCGPRDAAVSNASRPAVEGRRGTSRRQPPAGSRAPSRNFRRSRSRSARLALPDRAGLSRPPARPDPALSHLALARCPSPCIALTAVREDPDRADARIRCTPAPDGRLLHRRGAGCVVGHPLRVRQLHHAVDVRRHIQHPAGDLGRGGQHRSGDRCGDPAVGCAAPRQGE